MKQRLLDDLEVDRREMIGFRAASWQSKHEIMVSHSTQDLQEPPSCLKCSLKPDHSVHNGCVGDLDQHPQRIFRVGHRGCVERGGEPVGTRR